MQFPEKNPLDAVVITHNSERDIAACLNSLLTSGWKVHLVDNASSDRTLEFAAEVLPEPAIIRNKENIGYARAVNLGVAKASSEHVLISNADVFYTPESLEEMTAFMRQNPRVGAVGPQLVFPDGSWQRSYADVPGIKSGLRLLLGLENLRNTILRVSWPVKIDGGPHPVGYVDGAAMLVRRSAFDEINGFDENLYFYGEDADFCCRLRKTGWEAMFDPQAVVTHVRGASSTQAQPVPDRYLEMRAVAVLYVVRKHSGATTAEIYGWLELLHFLKLRLIYKMVRWSVPGARRAAFDRKLRFFEGLCRAWSTNLRDKSKDPRTLADL